MLNTLALQLISFYQRHLSHRKSYRCSYGVHHLKGTCSSRGKRFFQKTSFWKALRLLRRQFQQCHIAHSALQEQHTYKSYQHVQRGECDVPCPDVPADGCCEALDWASCGCDLFDLGSSSKKDKKSQ